MYKAKKVIRKNLSLLVILLLGTICLSLTMVKSGLCWNSGCSNGIGFWGANGHDGVWHIALARSLAKGSWQMPIFAGYELKNYHVGFDLLLAALHKLTFIPVHILYFQIIPPILAFFIGLSVYSFVLNWKKSKLQALTSVVFVYFGGSFGWIVTLLKDRKIDGETMFWAQQSVSSLINPPFALSILVIFAGMSLLTNGLRYGNKKKLMLASLLFGILVQIKVYAGILILGGLLLSGIWRMMKRRGTSLLKVFTGELIVSILVFSPTAGNLGKTLVYRPFWFLETMMQNPDRLGWIKFGEAMVNYKLGGLWLKAIPAYFIAFLIFCLGNFGTRLLFGIYTTKKLTNYKNMSWVEVFFISIIFAGVLIPTFFIQSGNSWNSIQFMYYFLIFSGILAGVALGQWVENQIKMDDISLYHPRVLVPLVIIIGLTVPTTIGTLWNHYLPGRPPAKLSRAELEALKFLEKQPDGVVLTIPFDKNAADAAIANPPRSLYLYESTAYVSAFSGQSTFLEDEVNLEITGYDWLQRREKVEQFLTTNDPQTAQNFLEENDISYLYWIKEVLGPVAEDQDVVKEIFKNDEVQILTVKNIEE